MGAFNTVVNQSNVPTVGSYNQGDIVWLDPSQNNFIGYVCIAAGSPGTWAPIGDSLSSYAQTRKGFTTGINQTKSILSLSIPNSDCFLSFEVKLILSRAPSDPAQSRIVKQTFTLARTTDSACVIDSSLATNDFELLTTTAGGSTTPTASSISLAVSSGGATATQEVDLSVYFGLPLIRGAFTIDIMSTSPLSTFGI